MGERGLSKHTPHTSSSSSEVSLGRYRFLPQISESSQSRTEEDGDHLPKSRRGEVFIMSLRVFVWERERRVQPRPLPPPPLLLRSLLLLSIYFPLRWRPGCAIAHFLLLLALKHFSILKIGSFKGQF